MRSTLLGVISRHLLISLVLLQTAISAIPINTPNTANLTGCPRIVSRKEWGARRPEPLTQLKVSPAPYVVIHHGGIKVYCKDQASCSAIARSYQDLHMDVNHWYDIGYNFLVGEDGNVYEGRGWDYVGAHAPNYNSQSIGICFMGDFSDFLPNDAALEALNSLIACGVSLGKINTEYKLLGHRQARKTLCPGETLYRYVMNLPGWTPNPMPNNPVTTPRTAEPNNLEKCNSIEKDINAKDNI
ncbi:hypothetical protein KM043_016383 [Ampulex compressa]|nr:hypothetical protein KM043_016383 [Ampulex compressa]